MTVSCTEISAGRVSAISAVLLMVLAVVETVIGSDVSDDASYRAGFVAASDASFVREAMSRPMVTSTGLCEELLARALSASDASGIVRRDFVNGCAQAIATVME